MLFLILLATVDSGILSKEEPEFLCELSNLSEPLKISSNCPAVYSVAAVVVAPAIITLSKDKLDNALPKLVIDEYAPARFCATV